MAGGEAPATPVRTFQSLAKQSVALQTVEAIKEMIRRGDLRPHQALPPERELARALDISRPTLREAIGALTAMNILESHHGDGTFVTSLLPQLLVAPISFLLQVDDSSAGYLEDIRASLEIEAARLAAARVMPEDLDGLDQLVRQAEDARDDPPAFARASAQFHAAIVAAAHNPLYENLHASVARFLPEEPSATGRAAREQAAAGHAAITRALRRRAPAAAAAAMLAHLGHGDHVPGHGAGQEEA